MQLWSVWMLTLPRHMVVQGLLLSMSFAAMLLLGMVALPVEVSRVLFPCLPVLAAILTLFQRYGDSGSVVRRSGEGSPAAYRCFLFVQALVGFPVGLLGALGAGESFQEGPWLRLASLLCLVALGGLTFAWWRMSRSRLMILAMPVVLAVVFCFSFGVDVITLPNVAFVLCWLYCIYVGYFHILGYGARPPMPFVRFILLAQLMCALGTFAGSFLGLVREVSPELADLLSSASLGISLICVLGMLSALMFLLQRTIADAELEKPKGMTENDFYTDMAARYGLTARERDVLELLSKGYSRPHISKELYLSESTVKTHAANLYRKLGVGKKDELLQLIAEQKDTLKVL